MRKLKAHKVDPTIIELEWQRDIGKSVKGYDIEYAVTPGSGWQPVAPAYQGVEPRYRHEELTPDTRYYYRVRAIYPNGERGVWSEVATASTEVHWFWRWRWVTLPAVGCLTLFAIWFILSFVIAASYLIFQFTPGTGAKTPLPAVRPAPAAAAPQFVARKSIGDLEVPTVANIDNSDSMAIEVTFSEPVLIYQGQGIKLGTSNLGMTDLQAGSTDDPCAGGLDTGNNDTPDWCSFSRPMQMPMSTLSPGRASSSWAEGHRSGMPTTTLPSPLLPLYP